MSTKKSTVITHLASKKHGNGKDKLKKSNLKDQTIMESFGAGDRTEKDSTLLITERAYRLEVVEEFLRAGIPIGKIDMLWSLLEKNGQRLTASAHLRSAYINCFKREVERPKNELTRDVSMTFDGSIRQGEAIAVIVRFRDDNWSIIQRLVRIDICSTSVNGDGTEKDSTLPITERAF